ncbi:MAG: hypothetical protein NTZ20_02835 [Candidatus Levybacteria bacterium]|nr:hypothetical protein [Candidatus Levybacteria bacterium]
MRKAITNLEIVYEQVEVSPEESEQRLNEMFDILFEVTLQYLKQKKEERKITMNEITTNGQLKKGDSYGKHVFN